MLDKIRLYFKLVGVAIRMQMQHRASFLMLSTAFFFSTFVDIIGIWVLFDRFKMVEGWTIKEVALLYGVMNMGFAIAESTARGFDSFSLMIKSGDFDRVLLRPVGSLFQIATREVQLMRIGRFLQGGVVLGYGYVTLQFSFFSWHTFIIALAIVGTSCMFYGIFILQATLAFWTTETLELMNVITYGGVESGQYPMSLYNPLFKLYFTFIVPLACVAYYPLATLLQFEDLPIWSAALFPLAGIIFLCFCCQFWKVGVRRYHSTGC